MTPEERKHMAKLVAQMEVEKDHHKITQLVEALDTLLAGKKHLLEDKPPVTPR